VFTFETADRKEVQRFRIAQFNGRAATVRTGATTVTGYVRSVLAKATGTSPCWIVTLIPAAPKPATKITLRSMPRFASFAEDDFS
jgi:hypothetical protein